MSRSLLAAQKAGVPVSCNSCGHQFPQDPCFEVACPVCHAGVGAYCKRPSEHQGSLVSFHAERDLLALKEGFYDHAGNSKCGPNSTSERAKALFAQLRTIPGSKDYILAKQINKTGQYNLFTKNQ